MECKSIFSNIFAHVHLVVVVIDVARLLPQYDTFAVYTGSHLCARADDSKSFEAISTFLNVVTAQEDDWYKDHPL